MGEKFRNKQRIYLHDPLAVGVVIDPDLAKKERVAIHVETEEGEHYGQTAEVEEGGASNMSWLHAHFSDDLAIHVIFGFDPETNAPPIMLSTWGRGLVSTAAKWSLMAPPRNCKKIAAR